MLYHQAKLWQNSVCRQRPESNSKQKQYQTIFLFLIGTHYAVHLVQIIVVGKNSGKTNLDFTGAREWVAVASAGPYASLHLAPDR